MLDRLLQKFDGRLDEIIAAAKKGLGRSNQDDGEEVVLTGSDLLLLKQ